MSSSTDFHNGNYQYLSCALTKLFIMATYLKKSIMTIPQLLVVTLTILLASSCKDPKENGEWIPVPKDTSALGRIDHFIPVAEISQYKKNYTAARDSLVKCLPNFYFAESEAFNKPQLLEVLKDPKCVGIRIYYGIKQDRKSELRCIIVGVDEQGRDLYIQKTGTAAAQTTPLQGGLEYGQCEPPCPSGR
jgi:hypothetical protein